MKIKRKKSKNNYGKGKIPLSIQIIKIFAICIFSIVMFSVFSMSLSSDKSLKKLSRSFIDSVDITDDFYSEYEKYGFSNEMYHELLEGDDFKEVVSCVMTNKMSALFKYSQNFEYEQSEAREDVLQVIKNFTKKNNLDLDDEEIEELVVYTCNISGISAMYQYDSPAAYRTSVFKDADIDGYDKFLELFAFMGTYEALFSFILMFIVLIVILYILLFRHTDVMPYKIGDTVLIPSIFGMALSFGELYCMNEPSPLQSYIFNKMLIICVASTVLGVLLLLLTLYISNYIRDKELFLKITQKEKSDN